MFKLAQVGFNRINYLYMMSSYDTEVLIYAFCCIMTIGEKIENDQRGRKLW